MIDPRWRRLSVWVRERERHYRSLEQRNPGVFGRECDRIRSETFQSVRIVMEAEAKKWNRERKRKKAHA
jgi:hypothetical protein